MSETGPVLVLEVEGSQVPSRALRLESGKKLDPISLGTEGQWTLAGAGVRDVHGFLAFDGAQVFVHSASPLYPLRVDGAPVGVRWEPVAAPARIAVGGLTLVLSVGLDDGPGAQQGPRDPQRRPVRGQDDESTRYLPVEATHAPIAPIAPIAPSHPLARALAPFDPALYETHDDDATRPGVPLSEYDDGDMTRVDAPLVAAPAPPPVPVAAPGAPLAPVASPAPALDPRVGIGPGPILDLPPAPLPAAPTAKGLPWRAMALQGAAQWKATSRPKKALLLMLPVAFLAVFVLFDDGGRGRRGEGSPAASVAAPSPVGALSSSRATASASAVAAPAPPRPSSSPPSPPSPPPSPRPPPSAPATAPAVSAGSKSPERMAVDAVVAGAYADAIHRYDELAREHPDRAAYREAARILRAKLDAGAR